MKEECKKRFHGIWPEMKDLIKRQGIHNYSIWNVKDLLFGYMEVCGEYSKTAEDVQLSGRWDEYMNDCYLSFASSSDGTMEMMYHDIGRVRESKENIRHRVFVTHLKPGMKDEYKRRHDVLIEKRGAQVNEGPASNFTIWHVGGYIFGYCEIDTAMEKPASEKERQDLIAWETKQLEIMDWVTNDVDWIFGGTHPSVELIFEL